MLGVGDTGHRSMVPTVILAVCALVALLWPHPAGSADRGKRWELGLDAGYVATSLSNGYLPEQVHGGTLALGLRYEFDALWFLALDARIDFHSDYQLSYPVPPSESEVASEEGAPEPIHLPAIERFVLSSVALGVGYFIDVYRVVPYMGAWLVGMRIDQVATLSMHEQDGTVQKLSAAQMGYDLGARLGLGVDWDLTPRITIGTSFGYDWFFTGATGYGRRLLLVAKAAYRFGSPHDRPVK